MGCAAPEEPVRSGAVHTKAGAPAVPRAFRTESTMAHDLDGCTIAVLATDGVEQVELTEPVKALQDAGARVDVVSDKDREIQAFRHHDKSSRIAVDTRLNDADAEDYDALVLPGGVINPDALRLVPAAIEFVRRFVEEQKPIAAICHGPWTLIDAGGVKGKTMTSWPSLKSDLSNAGAKWVDRPVVTDGKLITSRKPDDLAAFKAAMIDTFSDLHAPAK